MQNQTNYLLNKLNPNDSSSRRRWSIAIGVILVTRGTVDLAKAIHAAGEQHFLNSAGPILQGHHFHKEDLRRIYKIVCRMAQLNRSFSEKELHALLAA